VLTNQVVCFWDSGRAWGRLEKYPQYKATRYATELTEEELVNRQAYFAQMDVAITALRFAGVRQVRVSGVEADDLLGIYSRQYESVGDHAVVFTGDKDMHQLASPSVHIFDPKEGILSVADVLSAWGVPHIDYIPIVKALQGDNSDNIKGVPGIGPKRAAMIAPYYSLIAGVSERPDGIDDKCWKYIEAARRDFAIVLRNLSLVTLPTSWGSSFYDEEQRASAEEQMNGYVDVSMSEFVKLCTQWELDSVLENLHQW
jgi:DNA polymerase-1